VPFVTPHSFARFDRPRGDDGGFTAGIKRVHDAYGEWLEQNADAATDNGDLGRSSAREWPPPGWK